MQYINFVVFHVGKIYKFYKCPLQLVLCRHNIVIKDFLTFKYQNPWDPKSGSGCFKEDDFFNKNLKFILSLNILVYA